MRCACNQGVALIISARATEMLCRKRCQEQGVPREKDVKEKLGQEKEVPVERYVKRTDVKRKSCSENEMSRLRT